MAAASERFDLAIIGAGPAGLAAAEAGLALGASTVVIEAIEMGGVALNWGALPAHVLAASARRAHDIRNAADVGIGADDPRVNFARLNAHIKSVVEAARADVSLERLVAKGAEVIRHPAQFINRSTVQAGERQIKASRFILATGSRPFIPEIPGLDTMPYLTPETVFELTRRPGHLIIIGAGSTGVALAQSYRRLGAQVTLIDMLDPLGDVDSEFSAIISRRLAAEGVDIFANTGVISIAGGEDGVFVTLKTGAEEHLVSGTHLLVATGRIANLDTLDLAKAGVKWSPNALAHNMVVRTSNRRIYCVGDAAGTRSVQAARSMGAWAARHALNASILPQQPPLVPRLVASDPELVTVGLSEAQARNKYGDGYSVARLSFGGLDRARARARTGGHIKLITLSNGRIVGAGLCGDGASEIAAILALAIAQKLTPYDLIDLVAPYPALSEIVPLIASEYAQSHQRTGLKRAMARLKRLLP